jgi:hypothetical protein
LILHQDGDLRIVVADLRSVIQIGAATDDASVVDDHELAVDVAELAVSGTRESESELTSET